MPRLSIVFKRSLIFVHRWLGVALSALFLLWFVSGIVMMYWSFPEVTPPDRLQPIAEAGPRRHSADRLKRRARASGCDGPSDAIRLTSFDGRPVYRFGAVAVARGPAPRRRLFTRTPATRVASSTRT